MSLWSLLFDCWLAFFFFCSHTLKCILGGKMAASSFPPQCSALCHYFPSVSVSWYYCYDDGFLRRIFFNPLISSFSQEVHAQLIWTHYQRHSSVARWGTAFDPPTSCVAFGTAGNAGGCFSGLFKTKDLASLLSQCDLNPGPANPHTPLVDGSAGSCCSEEIPSHRIVLKSHFPLPVMS